MITEADMREFCDIADRMETERLKAEWQAVGEYLRTLNDLPKVFSGEPPEWRRKLKGWSPY